MKKIAIGLILRQLMEEKNLTPGKLASMLGLSRQAVYQDFNRMSLSDDKVQKYAEVYGMEKTEIYELVKKESQPSSGDKAAQSDEVLMRVLQELSDLKEYFQGQIAVKDQQISQLLGLLGKSEGVNIRPLHIAARA